MKTILYIQQRDFILKLKYKYSLSTRKLALISGISPSSLQRFINLHDVKCNWHLSTTTLNKICKSFSEPFPEFK